ncbi:MAG: baseplate J/gp47 family protein [Candidatus Limnocylindrus sp.]
MNIKQLIEARLREFDPSMDLSDNSPAQAVIVDPLVRALEPDALFTDARELIRAKVLEEYPDLTLGPGDAFTDIIVNASSLFLEPYRQALSRISAAQNISDPTTLADDDIDALASNWLVSRKSGLRASGNVQISLLTPRAVQVAPSQRFITNSGLVFTPRARFTVSAIEVLRGLNSSGQYVVTIPVFAEDVGAQYNISAGDIRSAIGVGTYASVTNVEEFTGGRDKESALDFLQTRLPRVIHERSLVTEGGIIANVLSDVMSVDSVEVAGFGDPEMTRDIADVGDAYTHVAAGVAVFGAAFCVVASRFPFDLLEGYVLRGTLADGQSVSARVGRVLSPPIDNMLVHGYTGFVVQSDFSAAGAVFAYISVLRAEPVLLGGEEVSRSTHLGGRADVYINPTSDGAITGQVSITPLGGIQGIGLESSGRRITLSGLAGRAERGQYLVLPEQGVRRAAAITDVAGDDVYTDTELSDLPADTTWRVVRQLETDITAEGEVIAEGTLSMIVGSREAVAPAELVRGALPGDNILVIETGVTYEIAEVGAQSCLLVSPADATGAFLVKITRSRAGIPAPLTHVHELVISPTDSLRYGECTGVHVLTSSDYEETRTGGVCRIVPKLSSLYPDGLASTLLTDREYRVGISSTAAVTGRTPYHYGTASPRFGSGVINVVMRAGANPVYAQVELPLDVFVPGAYNILAAYGDIDPEKMITAARAYYEGDNAAGELIESAVPADMDWPAPALEGNVIHAFGQGRVADAHYPVEIVFGQAERATAGGVTTTTLNPLRVLRVSLVRLSESLPPPYLSVAEGRLGRNDAVPLPNISLPDFLCALLDPSQLVQQGGVQAEVEAAVVSEGFSVGDASVITSLRDADVDICTLYVPSRGTARLYFESRQVVELSAPSIPRYSHDEALARMAGGGQQRTYTYFTAQDLRVASKGGAIYGGSNPRAWPRGADLRDVQVPLGDPAAYTLASFVGEYDEHDGLMDRVRLTLNAPTNLIVDARAGDELHVLGRSLTVESLPPVCEPLYFAARIGALGIFPGIRRLADMIVDGSIYDLVFRADGSVAPRDMVDTALRVDGYTFERLLASIVTLSPDIVVADDPSDIDALGLGRIFYKVMPRDLRISRPYVTTAARSRRLELARLYESQVHDVGIGLTNDYARVISSADASETSDLIRGVDGASSALIVDREMTTTTSPILARGWGRIFSAEATKLIIEGPLPRTDNQRAQASVSDNFSGVGAGGTTRLLSPADTGKHLTLINSVRHPLYGGSVSEGVQQIDYGTLKITSVNVVSAVDTSLNTSIPYRSEVTLSAPVDIPADMQHVDVFFQLSDSVPVDREELKTCKSVDVYRREPYTFKINAVPRLEDGYVFVSTPDDTSASKEGVGPLLAETLAGDTFNTLLSDALPFAIVRRGAIIADASESVAGMFYADIPFLSVARGGIQAGASRAVTSRVKHGGFSLKAVGQSFSVDDKPRVLFSPVSWVGGQRLERMQETFQAVCTRPLPVSDAHRRFASPRNRVLCSDLLARRMLPGRIGIFMRYEGGSDESIIREDVRVYVEGQARRRAALDVSDIIGLVYRRGVDRVLSPTHILVYVEDLSRRRHVLVVTDRFDVNTDVFYEGTTRITSVRAPDMGSTGITLDIQRV